MEQGYAVVAVNYRLSPAVKCPAHVEDVAQAFAWTRKNIGKYGGDQDRIFVGGGSAGGHISLIAAHNPSWDIGVDKNLLKGLPGRWVSFSKIPGRYCPRP